MTLKLPSYSQLPSYADAPPGSAWRLFGDQDQLGNLNLLTPERAARAASLVQTGQKFCLQARLHEIDPGLSYRCPPTHVLLPLGHGSERHAPSRRLAAGGAPITRDDRLDGFYPQGSSQWDAFCHVRHPVYGNFNGVDDSDLHNDDGAKLGIGDWAEHGIAGRGVLVDVYGFSERQGRPLAPMSSQAISADLLAEVLAAQHVTPEDGDIYLIRTGWLEQYLSLPASARCAAAIGLDSVGLAPSRDMVQFLWDLHPAAIAADNPAVECMPAPRPVDTLFLHLNLVPLLGIPLGELWRLGPLAAACQLDGRYDFMLISMPLNLRGGRGSPAQALAIR